MYSRDRTPSKSRLFAMSAALMALILLLLVASCGRQEDPLAPLGREAAPAPTCAVSSTPQPALYFGVERFIRASAEGSVTKKPTTEYRSIGGERFRDFLPPFILHVANGDPAGQDRVSSAVIMVDGQIVVAPADLNQQVAGLQREITITQDSELSVQLRSGPGSYLDLWIEATPASQWDACYYFETGPEETCGDFAPALVGGGATIGGGVLDIGDNQEDYAGLDDAILDGVTDFTMVIPFRIDQVKPVNTLFYLIDWAAGGGTQIAVRMVNGALMLNLWSGWYNTGELIAAGTTYTLKLERAGGTIRLYLGGDLVFSTAGAPSAPLSVKGGTVGGVQVTGILLGQDPYVGGTPPFGAGASLDGYIDDVLIKYGAP